MDKDRPVADEQARRGFNVRVGSGPVPREPAGLAAEHPAIANLRNSQKQLDADGTMVGVSRQALDEALAIHDGLMASLIEMVDVYGSDDGGGPIAIVERAKAAIARGRTPAGRVEGSS